MVPFSHAPAVILCTNSEPAQPITGKSKEVAPKTPICETTIKHLHGSVKAPMHDNYQSKRVTITTDHWI